MAASLPSIILICFLTYVLAFESSKVMYGFDLGMERANSSAEEKIDACPIYGCDASSETPLCQCDKICSGYSDCCWSWNRTFDVSPMNANLHLQSCITTRRPTTQPASTDYNDSFPLGYFMIDSCIPGLQDASLLQRCANKRDVILEPLGSWDEYRNHVPVVDKKMGDTYKNVYCARCNAVRNSDMSFWSLQTNFNCYSQVSPKDCSAFAFRPPTIDSEDNDYTPRPCFQVEVSSCPASTDNSTIVDLCDSYSAPFDLSGVTYRNFHCAQCNSDTSTTELNNCPDIFIRPNADGGLPQVIPFDFSFTKEENGTVYFCASGLSLNETSDSCELLPNSTEVSLEELCGSWNNSKTLRMVITNDEPMNKKDVLVLVESLPSLNNTAVTQWGVASCRDEKVSRIHCLVVESSGAPESNFLDIDEIRNELKSSSLRLVWVEEFISCAYRAPLISGECTYKGMYDKSDVTTFTYGSEYYVIIESENRVYSNVVMEIEISFTSSSSEGRNTLNISICDISNIDLKCPYSFLSADEFSTFPFSSESENVSAHDSSQIDKTTRATSTSFDAVKLHSPRFESVLPPEEFLLQPDRRAKVCSHWVGRRSEPYKTFLLVVYIVFTSMSLIALILTFANYCIFKSLRNLPGILTMNFIVALFFAQLILIASYLSPTNGAICTSISLLGHFLWLCSFVWMSTIAFNLARTFGSTTPNGQTVNLRESFAKYFLIGWVAPALFVTVCILLQTLTDLGRTFSYGKDERGYCWITPSVANVVIFGVPAMLCWMCNFVMFVVTARGIQKSKKSAKMATNVSTSVMVKEQTILFIKISVLVGLSWIWAFLYGFTKLVPFLFIHTFLNPLQGVFVFVVYICNRRTLAMWKEKFHSSREPSSGRQSLNLVSMPTSSTKVSETQH